MTTVVKLLSTFFWKKKFVKERIYAFFYKLLKTWWMLIVLTKIYILLYQKNIHLSFIIIKQVPREGHRLHFWNLENKLHCFSLWNFWDFRSWNIEKGFFYMHQLYQIRKVECRVGEISQISREMRVWLRDLRDFHHMEVTQFFNVLREFSN